jgi:tRNA(fMet)-specific endonuclease VapC
MIAFDTDVLSDLLARRPAILTRAVAVPTADQTVPIIVAEEVIRGRLNTVRQAEAGQGRVTLVAAYRRLEDDLIALRALRLLSYTDPADALFRQWRQQRLRVGTHDLRIAAIAVAHDATLVTRNARDYGQVPGLKLDVWT